jgi:hypothetical protein
MLVKCLYCDVENDALVTAGYCDSCGKKLPSSAMVRTKRAIATGSEGEDDGRKKRERSLVADLLILAAVVQLIAGGLFLVLAPAVLTNVPSTFLTIVFVLTLVPAVWLGLMGLLAQRQFRHVGIVALVGYLVWAIASFVWQPDVGMVWLILHGLMMAQLIVVVVKSRRARAWSRPMARR